MKSTIVQEISKIATNDCENEKDLTDGTSNNQQSLSTQNAYPKNIDNYFVLLKALYENTSLFSRIKGIDEQSCERRFESFKENIIANQLDNNGNSNQQQQHIQRKNININTKNESDNSVKEVSKTVGGERSLGNIINSLDVSINAAWKANYGGNYGNIDKGKIFCSTIPAKSVPLPLTSPDSQQLVTSSSSEPGEEEDTPNNRPITSSLSSSKNENNNLATHNVNDGPTRAVCSNRVEISKTVPDDISFDYHNIKYYDDDDKRTTSTTCNDDSTKYPNGADDAEDYHTKSIASIDTAKCNKENNSTGDIKPITSTYLLMTRSMGLTDEDALNLVSDAFLDNFLKRILRSCLTTRLFLLLQLCQRANKQAYIQSVDDG